MGPHFMARLSGVADRPVDSCQSGQQISGIPTVDTAPADHPLDKNKRWAVINGEYVEWLKTSGSAHAC